MVQELKSGPGTTPAPPTVEADELITLRSQLQENEKRRFGQDRVINNLQQEKERLLTALASGGNTQGLQARIDGLEESMASLLDAQGVTGEEETPLSHRERLENKRKAETSGQKAQWDAQVSTAWGAAVRICQRKQVPIETLTRDSQFMALWQRGDLEGVVDRASEIAAGTPASTLTAKKPEEEETEEQRIERIAEEKSRKSLRDRGLLKTEAGGGTGGRKGTFTRQQIAAMSDEEYQKNRPAIEAQVRQGNLP